MDFENVLVVVTGAGRGLGATLCRQFAGRGASVAVTDIDAENAERTAAALRESGARAAAFTVDVTDDGSVAALREAVLDSLGVPGVLVNNVGAYPGRSLREMTGADFDRVVAINMKSVFLVTRVFMDDMIAAGYGRVVNIASNDAYVAKPAMAHYAAAKAGVVSLTKTFALELAPHGVLVNGVSPGPVATEVAKASEWLPKAIGRVPVGYAAEPEDIGGLVLYLASAANRFVCGETVMINGGATMI